MSNLDIEEALSRARRMTLIPSKYKLGAGGRNPGAATPLTMRDGVRGCDCSGFVRWCWQIDRHQPSWFPLYDGWINCDSMLIAAREGAARYAAGTETHKDRFVVIPAYEVELGDAVVFPSIWKNGKRLRVGHEGIVTGVPAERPTVEEWVNIYSNRDRADFLKHIQVTDCNASFIRRGKGFAIATTTAYALWNKPDATFVRFLGLP